MCSANYYCFLKRLPCHRDEPEPSLTPPSPLDLIHCSPTDHSCFHNQDMDALTAQHKQQLHALRNEQEAELEALRKDHARKATMARNLLSEREADIKSLSTKLNQLQEEIDSGAPTERKILEIAKSQAQREHTHAVHADSLEVAFQALQTKVTHLDMQLGEMVLRNQTLEQQISQQKRYDSREGVNMDYLKNVIFKYMTFPIQAPERVSLVPVISMLLQFAPQEAAIAIQSAQNPRWDPKPAKTIDSMAEAAFRRSAHGGSG